MVFNSCNVISGTSDDLFRLYIVSPELKPKLSLFSLPPGGMGGGIGGIPGGLKSADLLHGH